MKRIKALLCVAGTLLGSSAFADVAFYERPPFMAESMPRVISCVLQSSHYGNCQGGYTAPADMQVKVANPDGSDIRARTINPLVTVFCKQGICSESISHQVVGSLRMDNLPADHMIRWTMIDGYYLYHDADKGVFAYKRGFGPLADKYPPYQIITEPVQRMSTLVDTTGTYDVVCLPASDDCKYNGNIVSRDELSKLIPKKGSDWCDNEFCYSNEYGEGVVGLNPDGFL
jgi:hypothetical protein